MPLSGGMPPDAQKQIAPGPWGLARRNDHSAQHPEMGHGRSLRALVKARAFGMTQGSQTEKQIPRAGTG